jgi:hypothetical protein
MAAVAMEGAAIAEDFWRPPPDASGAGEASHALRAHTDQTTLRRMARELEEVAGDKAALTETLARMQKASLLPLVVSHRTQSVWMLH